jgi:hypothetical protein
MAHDRWETIVLTSPSCRFPSWNGYARRDNMTGIDPRHVTVEKPSSLPVPVVVFHHTIQDSINQQDTTDLLCKPYEVLYQRINWFGGTRPSKSGADVDWRLMTPIHQQRINWFSGTRPSKSPIQKHRINWRLLCPPKTNAESNLVTGAEVDWRLISPPKNRHWINFGEWSRC